ncbi:MAG: FixH family protein [Thermomicrobium sp.]|uniref:FixH family protein n=1 Tax=Thermomicrobium sp. TaxID=1969469 RepID=UPI001B1743B1|nr:FixH family protein [Thermomicrobium sp.]MBO9360556.1 FixH family protein [Thermomicrobium sp.]
MQRLFRASALFLAMLIVVLPLTACRRGEARSDLVRLDIVAISPEPPLVGPAEIRLRLRDQQGQPLTGLGTIEVEGTMSHAGMEPVIVRAREVDDGIYVTQDFRFTMAGDWIIIARGTWNGQAFEARAWIAGVRAGTVPATPHHDQTSSPTPSP